MTDRKMNEAVSEGRNQKMGWGSPPALQSCLFLIRHGMEGVTGVRVEPGGLLQGVFSPPARWLRFTTCRECTREQRVESEAPPGSGEAALDPRFTSWKRKAQRSFLSSFDCSL